jgi:hypothetical protein
MFKPQQKFVICNMTAKAKKIAGIGYCTQQTNSVSQMIVFRVSICACVVSVWPIFYSLFNK